MPDEKLTEMEMRVDRDAARTRVLRMAELLGDFVENLAKIEHQGWWLQGHEDFDADASVAEAHRLIQEAREMPGTLNKVAEE